MPKADFGGLGKGARDAGSLDPVDAMPGSVQCQTCGDGGFVKRDDLLVTHRGFGAPIRCPHCDGARKPRNPRAESFWFIEWDRHARAAIRAGLGPPGLPIATSSDPEPPPETIDGTGVPVPSMVSEEQRQRAKARLAREIAALNERMRMVKERGA